MNSEKPSLKLFEAQFAQANTIQYKSQLVAFYLKNYILTQAVQFLKSERSQGKDVSELTKEVQTWFQDLENMKFSLGNQLQNEEMNKKQYYEFTYYQFTRCDTQYKNNVCSKQLEDDLSSVILLAEGYKVFESSSQDMDNLKNYAKTAHFNIAKALQARPAPRQSTASVYSTAPREYINQNQPQPNLQNNQGNNYIDPAQKQSYNQPAANPYVQPQPQSQPQSQPVNNNLQASHHNMALNQNYNPYPQNNQNGNNHYEELAKKQGYNLYTPNPDDPGFNGGQNWYGNHGNYSTHNNQAYAPTQSYNPYAPNPSPPKDPKYYAELAKQQGYDLYTPNPDDMEVNKSTQQTHNSKINPNPQENAQNQQSYHPYAQNNNSPKDPKHYEELAKQQGYALSTPNPDDFAANPPQSQNPYSPNQHNQGLQQNNQVSYQASFKAPIQFSDFQAAESIVVPKSNIDQRQGSSYYNPPPHANSPTFPQNGPSQSIQNPNQGAQHLQNLNSNVQVGNIDPFTGFQMTESGYVSKEILDQVKSQVKSQARLSVSPQAKAMNPVDNFAGFQMAESGFVSKEALDQVRRNSSANPMMPPQNIQQAPTFNYYVPNGNQGPSSPIANIQQAQAAKNPLDAFQMAESVAVTQASLDQNRNLAQQGSPNVRDQAVAQQNQMAKNPLNSLEGFQVVESVAVTQASLDQNRNLSQQEQPMWQQPGFPNNSQHFQQSQQHSQHPNGMGNMGFQQAQNLVSAEPAKNNADQFAGFQMAESSYFSKPSEQNVNSPNNVQAQQQGFAQALPNQGQSHPENKMEVEHNTPFPGFQGVQSLYVPQAPSNQNASASNKRPNPMDANQLYAEHNPFYLAPPPGGYQNQNFMGLGSPNFGGSNMKMMNQPQENNGDKKNEVFFDLLGLNSSQPKPIEPAQNQLNGFNMNQNNQAQPFNFLDFKIDPFANDQSNMNQQQQQPAPVFPVNFAAQQGNQIINTVRGGLTDSEIAQAQQGLNQTPYPNGMVEEKPASPVVVPNRFEEKKLEGSKNVAPSKVKKTTPINLPEQHYFQLREWCRMTVSELDFKNVKEAKDNIRRMIELISQYE